MFSLSPCRNYRNLRLRSDDERLSARQQRFLENHVGLCLACREYDRQVSQSRRVLRTAATEPLVSAQFTSRVIGALTLDRLATEWRLWRPAMLGALTACLAIGAIVQVLTVAPQTNPATPVGTAGAISEDRPYIFEPEPQPEDAVLTPST